MSMLSGIAFRVDFMRGPGLLGRTLRWWFRFSCLWLFLCHDFALLKMRSEQLKPIQALLPAPCGAMAMLATCATKAAVVKDPLAASAATRIAPNSSSPMWKPSLR
jgi:hypothetical protein